VLDYIEPISPSDMTTKLQNVQIIYVKLTECNGVCNYRRQCAKYIATSCWVSSCRGQKTQRNDAPSSFGLKIQRHDGCHPSNVMVYTCLFNQMRNCDYTPDCLWTTRSSASLDSLTWRVNSTSIASTCVHSNWQITLPQLDNTENKCTA